MQTCSPPDLRCTNIGPVHTARRRAGVLAVTMLLGLGACDRIPTAPPKFETRLILPGESTTLSVNNLLPANVTVQGTSFRLTVPGSSITPKTLAQMCAECAAAPPGVPVPKPQFSDNVVSTINLPADVTSATVTSGNVSLQLTHNFGFDVVRPGGAPGGSIVVTIRNGTTVVGTTTYTGPFASGVPLTLDIPLVPGVISGTLQATVAVVSPAAVVAMNSSGTITGTVTPGAILISEARVALVNKTVTADPVSIDLSEVDDVVRDHVVSGAFVVTMTNPFATTGNLNLVVQGAGMTTIQKTLTIATGTTTQRIAFTQAQLQAMFGRNITIAISGPISATGGSLVVRPGQVVTVSTNLDIIFLVGT